MSDTAQADDPGRQSVLRLQGVSLSRGKGATSVTPVSHLSFELRPGGSVALMGPSGSGKTSVLMSLRGELEPSSGAITIDGAPLSPAVPTASVYQDYRLAEFLTATENVMMPLQVSGVGRREAQVRAVEALGHLGLTTEQCARRPLELSGGQQQRVAIARATVGAPLLILADEPTGALDADTGQSVGRALVAASRRVGGYLVVATHDHAVAALCDDAVLLSSYEGTA